MFFNILCPKYGYLFRLKNKQHQSIAWCLYKQKTTKMFGNYCLAALLVDAFFVDVSLFSQTVITYSLCPARTQYYCHLCNVLIATLCHLKVSIIDIRLHINSQLRQNFNTSHTHNKRRPMHKFTIFSFVVFFFAFENKCWFEISFSHTMQGVAPM